LGAGYDCTVGAGGMRLTIEKDRERIKRYGHMRPAPAWGAGRCSALCPGTSRACTLEQGHRGPHVAHGLFRRVVAVWDAGIKSPTTRARGSAGEAKKVPSVVVRRERRDGGLVASIRGLRGRISRRAPSMEGVFLVILGLGMVWFAVEAALRILGWR